MINTPPTSSSADQRHDAPSAAERAEKAAAEELCEIKDVCDIEDLCGIEDVTDGPEALTADDVAFEEDGAAFEEDDTEPIAEVEGPDDVEPLTATSGQPLFAEDFESTGYEVEDDQEEVGSDVTKPALADRLKTFIHHPLSTTAACTRNSLLGQRLSRTTRWHWILGSIALLTLFDLVLYFFGDSSYNIIFPKVEAIDTLVVEEKPKIDVPEYNDNIPEADASNLEEVVVEGLEDVPEEAVTVSAEDLKPEEEEITDGPSINNIEVPKISIQP